MLAPANLIPRLRKVLAVEWIFQLLRLKAVSVSHTQLTISATHGEFLEEVSSL